MIISRSFFALNVKSLKKFFRKCCSICKISQKTTLKDANCSHNLYMRHQLSILDHFSLSLYKPQRKILYE